MDRISDLPDNVVDRILECLSLGEAVRTSNLSTKWQYKWVTLSKICVDLYFISQRCVHKIELPPNEFVNVVKSILLQHRGPILQFSITIPELDSKTSENYSKTREDLILIVRFALRNGARELSVLNTSSLQALVLNTGSPQALPSCLFSCGEQLTKLELRICVFNPPLGFKGFPNLKALHLTSIECDSLERLSNFISSCPALEVIKLDHLNCYYDQHLSICAPRVENIHIRGIFRSISLEEVQHLVALDLYLTEQNSDFERPMAGNDYILGLLSNMPKIKSLRLGGCVWEVLKDPNPHFGSKNEDEDFCLEQLRTVKIEDVNGFEGELDFIEYLLNFSPVLEDMFIQFGDLIDEDEEKEVMKKLLKFFRASPRSRIVI